MPKIKTQWLLNLKKEHTITRLIEEAKRLRVDGIGTKFNQKMFTTVNIKRLQDNELYWNIWTINKTDHLQKLKKLKIDFITTDRPLYIRKSLN